MGWRSCLAALRREFSNRGIFLLHDTVHALGDFLVEFLVEFLILLNCHPAATAAASCGRPRRPRCLFLLGDPETANVQREPVPRQLKVVVQPLHKLRRRRREPAQQQRDPAVGVFHSALQRRSGIDSLNGEN